MAGYRSSGGILSQYQGFPALIFFALKDSAARSETISARLNMLVHIFAYLRAALPEKKELTDEGEIEELINDIDKKIKDARVTYQAVFEEESTYTEKENEFLQKLDQVLYLEAEVIARTKLIDSQRMTDFEAPAGTT